MIALTKIRELNLCAPASEGRPSHLSAASGLVCVKSFIYVVADDELHLGVFHVDDDSPGDFIRLFAGVLPDPKAERKKEKPDLEALTLLPAYRDYPNGALLALGSGSRRNRRFGALVGLSVEGAISGAAKAVDLSPILAPLEDAFSALNIEGAVVSGDELRLFQRGNKGHGENAIVRYGLSSFLEAFNSNRTSAIRPSAIQYFDLGHIDGVPFCFTDAAVLPDGEMIFTAVAEDTDDSYNDGPCRAAAIGMAENDGRLRWLRRLEQPYKVEGIDARGAGDVIKLLLVTDADDADIPAGLFSAVVLSV